MCTPARVAHLIAPPRTCPVDGSGCLLGERVDHRLGEVPFGQREGVAAADTAQLRPVACPPPAAARRDLPPRPPDGPAQRQAADASGAASPGVRTPKGVPRQRRRSRRPADPCGPETPYWSPGGASVQSRAPILSRSSECWTGTPTPAGLVSRLPTQQHGSPSIAAPCSCNPPSCARSTATSASRPCTAATHHP